MPSTSNVEKIRDRRAYSRIAIKIPVELRDESYEYMGTALDLSPGGLRVQVSDGELSLNGEYDVVLKPAGEPPLKLKGRVMHLVRGQAGIALAIGEAQIFESAYNLYESILFKDPKLALRVKKRPSSLDLTQRLWPLPLGGALLSGPEHWVYGNLKAHGVTVADLKQLLGAEWPRHSYVPFMLVERGLIALTEPAQPIEEVPDKPIGRGLGSPLPAARPGLAPRKPGTR